jgi:regulator of sigma E protease
MINFLLVFFSLIFLIILHEFSHFLAAKKSGVFVEEFGIGYPPRIFGKKFGETLYSINLLPFGAFVKLKGEIGEEGFSQLSLLKRIIIVLAGVISFWIIGAIIFILLFKIGIPMAISDDEVSDRAKVQIVQISKNSPAEISKLKIGDVIREFRFQNEIFKIDKVGQLQELIQKYKGQEITLKIERGKEIFNVEVVPRVHPPEGQGPMGIVLARVEIKKYPLFHSIFEGIKTTGDFTISIIKGYFLIIGNLFKRAPMVFELSGPVGIFNMMYQTSKLGTNYFLYLLAAISINLAIFNLLPIPALDGGKLLFLTIEGIRKKAISPETEEKITALFFGFLLILAILVTIKDISKILSQ